LTVNRTVKRTLSAGIALASLATLVTLASVSADIVCTVSVALTISDVFATKISHNHATISWRTDGKTTSQVSYDTISHDSIGDYAYSTAERKALAERHKAILDKLSPSTTYYYRVRSAAGSAESVSDEYTFTTLPSSKEWKGWLADAFLEFTSPFYFCWLW
jgi:hypothetical protein